MRMRRREGMIGKEDDWEGMGGREEEDWEEERKEENDGRREGWKGR